MDRAPPPMRRRYLSGTARRRHRRKEHVMKLQLGNPCWFELVIDRQALRESLKYCGAKAKKGKVAREKHRHTCAFFELP